jgi:siroheme synthase-like protein
MHTHPVFLRLAGRRCVIIGGGLLAEEKARRCLDAGASVVVVAGRRTPGIEGLGVAGRLTIVPRDYEPGDLAGAALAYAEVREPATIDRLRDEADRARVPLNVIDVPDACDFFSPAVVTRGPLRIAIGTGGTSPMLAARLRRELEARFGPEYGPYAVLLGAVREYLERHADRAGVLARLVDSELLAHVRDGDATAVDRVLREIVGEGCSLGRLQIALDGGC